MIKIKIPKLNWKSMFWTAILTQIIIFGFSGCDTNPEDPNKIETSKSSHSLNSGPRNTGIHWLTMWPTSGTCSMKKGSNRSYNDEKVKYWQDEMKEYGWSKENNFGNSLVFGQDFVEDEYPTTQPGWDDVYFDDAKAALLATHGGLDSLNNWRGSLNTDHNGYGCKIQSKHMRLGEPTGGKYGTNPGNLDFFHNLACWSVTKSVAKQTWKEAFQGIHFITGYDKISFSSWWNNDDLEDFAYWAHDHWFNNAEEMSYEWLDQLTHWNWPGGNDDTCPVVITVDQNYNKAKDRMYKEKYKSNWDDVPRNDWHSFRKRSWSNCYPKS